jgi:putative endonuclease
VAHPEVREVPHARQRTGARGEELAAAWYQQHGYEIVARNWRTRAGELDIVAARCGTLVICEVKTRASDRFGSAAEAVTLDKQQRVRAMARVFLAEHDLRPKRIRFDVAAVRGVHVEVITDAF